MLLREGLLDAANRLFRLPAGFYGLTTILLFVACLTLARVRNPEALRYQAPGEWGAILGLDRCPEAKTLRRKLRLLTSAEHTVRDWQAELARGWASAHDDDWATLAVDGHVKVYAGRNGRLPKHFVARQKLCLPASVSYWVNALGGAPLLCLHKALDLKLVKADLARRGAAPAATGGDSGSGPRPDRAARRGASAHPGVRPRGLEPRTCSSVWPGAASPASLGTKTSRATTGRRRSSAPLRYRSTGPPVPALPPLTSPSSGLCCATGSRCADRRRLANGRQVPVITSHPDALGAGRRRHVLALVAGELLEVPVRAVQPRLFAHP